MILFLLTIEIDNDLSVWVFVSSHRSHARGSEGKVFGAQGGFDKGRFLATRSAFEFLFTLRLRFTKPTCLFCYDASNTSLLSG